jgi:hypothetical protein
MESGLPENDSRPLPCARSGVSFLGDFFRIRIMDKFDDKTA